MTLAHSCDLLHCVVPQGMVVQLQPSLSREICFAICLPMTNSLETTLSKQLVCVGRCEKIWDLCVLSSIDGIWVAVYKGVAEMCDELVDHGHVTFSHLD